MENFSAEAHEDSIDNLQDTDNQTGVLKLPIGFSIGGKDIMELQVADTGSEAEKIYTKKPKQGKVQTWIGQVIAVSVTEIAGTPVASEFIKSEDKNNIPDLVKQIPFLDAATLLLQIQKECWEEVIPDQRVQCVNCGTNLKVDIELEKLAIPDNGTGKPLHEYVVKLKKPHIIKTGVEILEEYEGYKFNRLKFRTATLGDAITHEGVMKDEVLFWRNLAFDTLLDLYHEDENGEITPVPKGFIVKRGKTLFNKDFDTKKLKEIRSGMQTTQPSMKASYEEECPSCSEMTPLFAQPSYFFQA